VVLAESTKKRLSSIKASLRSSSFWETENGQQTVLSEPVAVIGMACRLPGGIQSTDALWKALAAGVDGIGEVPAERWDASHYYDADAATPAKINTRFGGFLDQVDKFDPHLFGIAPREAKYIDPQHRILLEVAWDAFLDAGYPLQDLQGTRTGVFFGLCNSDYGRLQLSHPELISAHTLSGTAPSISTGRLSYLYDLRGPSMVIDTACSSSLVAIHSAVQSLRCRDSSLAIAGGISLNLTPEETISLAKWGMLAPDGRCKTFDEKANGFVRSEGCGLIVMKRLSDALRHKDRVLAVIRGSAINQDGRSNVLTAPNGEAQRNVIAAAMGQAGVSAADIGFVETHGTGTKVGDPIEVEALRDTVGAVSRNTNPCYMGAIKANFGHLEAAAGVAGVIKAVLCIKNGKIPPQPHFHKLNPLISLDDSRLRVPTELVDWTADKELRVAGVSSFGFSGTNAHLVIEQAPELPQSGTARPQSTMPYILPVSSHFADGLDATASAVASYLLETGKPERLENICYTAARRRQHFPHRFAVAANSREALSRRLHEASAVSPGPVGQAPRIGFVFAGQGCQWAGMGRALLAQSAEFSASVEAVDAEFRRIADWSIVDLIRDEKGAARLDETRYFQPVLFAIQVGLAALWKHAGVVPSLVCGHSVGEIAAAHVAGAISISDALSIVELRGRLMQESAGSGAMAAVGMPLDELQVLLQQYRNLAIAADNGPENCTITGDAKEIDQLLLDLQRRGVFCRRLNVDSAYHSALMDGHAQSLFTALEGLTSSACDIPFVSTVTGEQVADSHAFNAAYWRDNMRKPVRFREAIKSALDEGCDVLVEIGPQPVLATYIAEIADAAKTGVVALASMRKADSEGLCWSDSLSKLYSLGCNIDWQALYPHGAPVSLPPFQFRKERLWFETPAARPMQHDASQYVHPLLGIRKSLGSTRTMFESLVGTDQHSYLFDHRIAGYCIFPAAAMIEMMLAAAEQVGCVDSEWAELSDFSISAPVVLTEEQPVEMQLLVEQNGESLQLTLYSQAAGAPVFSEVATATWRPVEADRMQQLTECFDRSLAACDRAVNERDFYASGTANGIEFGPAFQSLAELRQGSAAAAASLKVAVENDPRFLLHPVHWDACLQTVDLALRDGAEFSALMLPTAIDTVVCKRGGLTIHTASSRIDRRESLGESAALVESAVFGLDKRGECLLAIQGAQFMEATAESMVRLAVVQGGRADEIEHFELAWTSLPSLEQERDTVASNLFVCTNSDTLLESIAHSHKESGAHAAVFGMCTDDVEDIDCKIIKPASRDSVRQALTEINLQRQNASLPRTTDIVFDWRDEAQTELGSAADLSGDGLLTLLYLLQSLLAQPEIEIGRVVVVTGSANALAAGMDTNASQAAIWGLGIAAQVEHPELHCALLDLGAGIDGRADANAIASVLRRRDSNVDRLAYRDGQYHLPQIVTHERAATIDKSADGDEFQIRAPDDGVLDSIEFAALSERAPGAGEVSIRTAALGVNFRDLLNCLGEVEGPAGRQLGAEVAGTVVATGAGVSDFVVGDRVMAFCLGGMASTVNVPASRVTRAPCNVSLPESAGLPVVFLTAIYALRHLAAIDANSRVLIHSAAGGVGLAAIQIASNAGAQIFATAGSRQKRRALRRMGIEHVFDSRSAGFRDEILRASDGKGVDVVLNSLSGELINASLDCMAEQGTFLELGKRDNWTQDTVNKYRRGVRYVRFDIGEVADENPELINQLLDDIATGVEANTIRPISTTIFPARKLPSAFRLMSQGLHSGKIVLTTGSTLANVHGAEVSGRAVLISGGLGALGLDVAEAMVAAGWKQIVLMGRSMPGGPVMDRVEKMRAAGAEVSIVNGDVANRSELGDIVDTFETEERTIRAVVHCAGELNDAAFMRHTKESFAATLRAKVAGSWNIHDVFSHRQMDFVIFFSSVASVLGWPGQANYAAANAYMDALAHYRRARGLPALSINWGAWQSGGMIGATKAASGDVFTRFGIRAMDNHSAVDAMMARTESGAAQAILASIDWRQFRQRFNDQDIPHFYSSVIDAADVSRATAQADAGPRLDMRSAVSGKQGPALLRAVSQHIDAMARTVLGIGNTHELDHDTSLNEQGLDSLLAVEMRNRLSKAIDMPLPASIMFDYPTVVQLSAHLVSLLKETANTISPDSRQQSGPRPGRDDAVVELRDSIEALSDADAEDELLKELESLSGHDSVEEK
tara:strand:- start:20980 stop:27615 length:6636 start_codon:yes stop_codon:yes gene_type:complete